MSEKVVLTQEQVNAIELWLSNYKDKDQLLMIQYFVKVKEADASTEGWIGDYKPMKELSISQLARAIHVGYEIEKPKFQAGDKIIHCNEIFTLEEKHNLIDSKVYWSFKEAAGTIDESYLTKATEEEIYWLHKLGRKRVPDFHVGDAIATYEDEDLDIVVSEDCYVNGKVGIRNAGDWFESGIIKGIYPAESFKPFRKDEAK